jgi:UDPglucose--hexose-1-phosphate uridylyltransferase
LSTGRQSHRRYNPLLDEWVLCSPGRLDRPWQGQTEPAPEEQLPSYDPACALCPGNSRAKGARNPAYAGTFAFDNDFPALTRSPAAPPASREALLRSQPESGVCRVLCFSPRHDLTLAGLSNAGIRGVVDAWAEEVSRLGAQEGIGHVQVFENKGAMMGCSNPHPHCQVWATEHLPTSAQRRLGTQRRYLQENGRDLLGDYLSRERVEGERIVCANDHWAVLVPFWAAWPFETLLIAKAPAARLSDLDDAARDDLTGVLHDLLGRYDGLFKRPFPYSMGWHQAPFGDDATDAWQVHAHFYPPLLFAKVRKFMVGYELLAETQRDLTAEEAATRLRAVQVAVAPPAIPEPQPDPV